MHKTDMIITYDSCKYNSKSSLSSSIYMLNHLTIAALTYVKSARDKCWKLQNHEEIDG
jgi:hypothetical protein